MSTQTIARPELTVSVLSTGFALFSMFFGAGNIIFPLIIGRLAADHTPYAIAGLAISAVAFPLLGLYAMMLFSGNITAFLARVGKWPAIFLLFALQMSQGPVGSLPRLVTLMHASVKPYLDCPLWLFSSLVCALVFFLCRRPSWMIRLLGSYLTPALLTTLGALVCLGYFFAPEAQPAVESAGHYFGQGLKMGYQTTDLLAAILFATMILPHLSQGTKDPKVIRKRMINASLIASALLMVVYIGLCWISARYSWTFGAVAPEELLGKIALKIFGPFGGLVSSTAVFLACLTTAISLAAVFAQYLQQDVTKGKLNQASSLGVTLGIAALMAMLGFSGIVKMWGPLLDILYPVIIVLCVWNIWSKFQASKRLV